MALTTMVFVPKPDNVTYSDCMREIRMWLDHHRIQTVGFKITAGGAIGFEVGFSSERDAATFRSFGWRHPL